MEKPRISSRISAIASSQIAVELMSRSDDRKNQSLCFAVIHVHTMLSNLKRRYFGRWHGERLRE